jgi:hypothetical protein
MEHVKNDPKVIEVYLGHYCMTWKSGNRFFLGTNAKRLPGDRAPGKGRLHDPIQSNWIMMA